MGSERSLDDPTVSAAHGRLPPSSSGFSVPLRRYSVSVSPAPVRRLSARRYVSRRWPAGPAILGHIAVRVPLPRPGATGTAIQSAGARVDPPLQVPLANA